MEELQVIRELFLGLWSLISFTLFIFILYLLFYLKYSEKLNQENKMLVKSLVVTISFICFLCLSKQLIFEFNLLTYPNGLKYISAGTILQLYLPIQVYTSQRCNDYFSKFRDVIMLSAGVFFLNITIIATSLFVGIRKPIVLQYLIQISIVALIVYQYYILSPTFKDIFSSSNENSFSLKIDLFLFALSSTIALFLTLSLFTALTPYKREATTFIMGLTNIVLLLKVIYYSSRDYSFAIETNHLRAPISLSNNDFFNKKKDDDLKNRLLTYFETEKPYLDPKLKINEVALYLYSNKTYLSRLINDHYNNNFSQFVNYYRINLAKDLFIEDNTMSIQQLCYESGFGSMATFTMAFRLNVGKSPAEWCKEQKIKGQNENQEE